MLKQATAQQGDIKGGWIECRYVNDNPFENVSIYSVVVHVFSATRFAGVSVNVYDANTGDRIQNLNLSSFSDTNTVTNHFSACTNISALNNLYKLTNTNLILRFPIGPKSYFVTASARGRDGSIINFPGPSGFGILYSTTILGTVDGVDYHRDANPVFLFTDTFSVCKNQPFTYPIKVTDGDGDSLSYRLGYAIQAPFDTTSPPLFPMQYNPSFSGMDPLGTGATIDAATGVISGVAPSVPGGYNITVYVDEWRGGKLINTARKESQIKVTNCPFRAPLLKPLFSGCRVNTFTFANEPSCPVITQWQWDFGVPNTLADTSNLAGPTFTYPAGPGSYTVQLKVANEDGYIDSATTLVKIFDSITVILRPDTSICKKDIITLRPLSDATNYLWRETGGNNTLGNYMVKNPGATPKDDTTVYVVTGRLDNCVDSASTTVYASPYPQADAGADTVICQGSSVQLKGAKTGAIFNWLPINDLTSSNTLQPIAMPAKTISYVLAVRDTFYCPKTVTDTVKIKVVPPFLVDAGKYAFIVYGQPYQLQATTVGNTEIVTFQWSPSTFLSSTNFPNPTATITNENIGSMRFSVTATTVVGKCSVTDDVVLRLFKTGPDILVPSAFTPNNDGMNDILKPILIGIQQFDYFNIYNRYGQLIFRTSAADNGWDGRINGELQSSGTYVFVGKGKDFNGKQILKKGTVQLIK